MQHTFAPVSTVIGIIELSNSMLMHNASEVFCIVFIVCEFCAVIKGCLLSAVFGLKSSVFLLLTNTLH